MQTAPTLYETQTKLQSRFFSYSYISVKARNENSSVFFTY